jgi:hypothetical protein
LWPIVLCRFSADRHAAALEGVEHRNDLGDRHLGLDGVEHDEVRRFADCETVGEADVSAPFVCWVL